MEESLTSVNSSGMVLMKRVSGLTEFLRSSFILTDEYEVLSCSGCSSSFNSGSCILFAESTCFPCDAFRIETAVFCFSLVSRVLCLAVPKIVMLPEGDLFERADSYFERGSENSVLFDCSL